MKKNIDGEKIVLAIVIMIILIVIGYLIFSVFTSNSSLSSNSTEKNTTDNLANNNTNSNNENTSNNPSSNNTNKSTNNTTQKENETVEKEIKTGDSKVPTTPANEKPVEPKKEEVIATFTTTIYDKDANRVANISLANSKLNGKIIKNGEEFSFNNTIGPMNEAQGFKKALGFDSKGKKIQISGGGLCQISSTIYNAVLIAGLNVTERHPHSKRVYYVPKDKDATIVYGKLDFKFVNTSGSDIRIDAANDNVNVRITLVKI